jgi:hypothetical protein
MGSEISAAKPGLSQEHEFGTSKFSKKQGLVNCRTKMGSKFLEDASFKSRAREFFIARLKGGGKKKLSVLPVALDSTTKYISSTKTA